MTIMDTPRPNRLRFRKRRVGANSDAQECVISATNVSAYLLSAFIPYPITLQSSAAVPEVSVSPKSLWMNRKAFTASQNKAETRNRCMHTV